MRNLTFFLILFFTVSSAHAQPPFGGGGFGGANRGVAGQQLNGRLYGKIIDSITGKPVEFVSVQLLQNKIDSVTKERVDVVIGGMLTKANGDFSIENVPLFGPLKLKITAIGFKEIIQPVSFNMRPPQQGANNTGDMSSMLAALDKDLGNIKIEVAEKLMDNVTVQASGSPTLQLAIDRKVFNVEKNIVSAGGTAVDVMRNIPSLSVDIDGNVTMRNSSPQVFVDGRPTTMSLDQIPADAIESVELITNPSAKFDASGGTAGILNVVLKKNRKVGYNGSVRINADSRGMVGGGADINVRQNKVNFFSSINYFPRKSIGSGTTFRNTFIGTPNSLAQFDESTQKNKFMFVRAGFDYFIDNRNTISLSGSLGGGKFNSVTTSELFTTYQSGPVASTYGLRNSDADGNFNFKGFQGSFKHNFPKQGQEWTADVTYNKRDNKNDNFINTGYYASKGSPLDSSYLQKQISNGFGSNLVVQTDFVNPLTDNSKLEAGLRLAYNDNNNLNNIYQYDEPNNQYVLSPLLSSDFKSRSTIYAGYATYTNQVKNFGYQLGLRVESSTFNGKLPSKGQEFDIDFPLSLFPSIFLSQKLPGDQDLQLNYSRRINRPNFMQLFPFIDYTDSLNLSRGNPELDPEFTNSLELSYQKLFKNKDNLLASLYYKHTNNLITRSQVTETNPINNKEQLINSYINANSSYVAGLELTLKNKITNFWELVSNANLFTSKIKIDDPNIPKQDQFFSWFAKLNNNFKLPKNFTLQVSGEYQSRTVLAPGGSAGRGGGFGGGMGMGGGGGFYGGNSSTAQGYNKEYFTIDAAIRFDFLKSKAASVSLNVNDIFRTRLSKVYSESPYFNQDVSRRRDPQVFRLNLSWRFGKLDPTLLKRKNTRGEREANNMEGAMPMGQ